jgi:hypothetical protein
MYSGTTDYPQAGVTPLGIDESTTSTAEAARPLPLFWGTQKLGVTFISGAFNERASERSISTGKSDQVVGYDYYIQFAAMVCHGPVDAIHEIRYNDEPIWKPDQPVTRGTEDYVDLTIESQYGTQWRFYWGTETQTIDRPPVLEPRAVAVSHAISSFYLAGHGFTGGTKVEFSGDTLPAGISERKTYFALYVDGDWFQIAETAAGSALTFTTDGKDVTVRRLHALEHEGPFYLSDLSETWWPSSGANRAAEYHPAHLGQCYIVARQHALGYNTTQLPQIEIIVSRWPGGDGKIGDAGHQDIAIPAVVSDAMTNERYGLGLPASAFNSTDFAAIQINLATEGMGISPFIDRAQPFDQFLLDMLGYVDGYYYAKPDGTLSMGLSRGVPCSATDANAIVFDEASLTELPSIECSSLDTTRTEVRVQFRNGDVAFKDDCCAGHSAGALQTAGSPSAKILDRPWVTRIAVADKMARAAAKHVSIPAAKGTLTVRKSKLQGLRLGGGFYFNYAHYGLCWLHCRATEITIQDPFAPVVEIGFEQDLGYLNGEVYDATSGYTAPSAATVAPPDLTDGLLLELPSNASAPTDARPCFVALVSRPDATAGALVGGCVVSWEDDAELSHYTTVNRVSTSQPFQPRLELQSDVSAADETINVRVLSPWDRLPDEVLSPAAGQVDWLLVFHGDGVDEIMAVTLLSLISDGSYTLYVRRGALDTMPQAIGTATPGLVCFAVRLATLNALRFQIPSMLDLGATLRVKVQSVLGSVASSASTALTLTAPYEARTQRPWKPKGLVSEWPAGWSATTTAIAITWEAAYKTSPLPLTWEGPRWVIDVRLPSDSFDITNPAAGRRYTGQEAPDITSHSIDASELASMLGGRQTCVVRLYSVQTGLASLHWDEKEIPYA